MASKADRQRRKMAEASLDLSQKIEDVVKAHKLSLSEALELVHGEFSVYLRAAGRVLSSSENREQSKKRRKSTFGRAINTGLSPDEED